MKGEPPHIQYGSLDFWEYPVRSAYCLAARLFLFIAVFPIQMLIDSIKFWLRDRKNDND